MNVLERITSLRSLMKKNNIDAYIINGGDPHLSEYVPEKWRTREWISGFTGSYGRVVVTHEISALWTDSRYFLQAEAELKGSGIMMMKDRQQDTISYDEWILSALPSNSVVGIDGLTISAVDERKLDDNFSAKGIGFIRSVDLVSPIWYNRPDLPEYPAYDYPVEYAGITRNEKINLIRQKLKEKSAEGTIISMLDDLAWTFNIRGSDIKYNPLVTCYGFIDQERAILFINPIKIPDDLKHILIEDHIELMTYESIIPFIQELTLKSIYIDPERTNSIIYHSIPDLCEIKDGISIPILLKSIKNDCEIAGMREAHRRDGAAMINFLHWITLNVGKVKISELGICNILRSFRSQQDHFVGESFHSIVGYAEHGAIVHYHVTEETDLSIYPTGILLIDSGGQYLDGTTDITRTISLGEVTQKQQTDYTLVLKGMIQLAKAVFPINTRGNSLDVLARKALWNNHLDYGHGTGHGVGHFLCVHEGPMSIRQDLNQEFIKEGNILSNEPGLYREKEYGIRIENLILCQKDNQSEFGSFLKFNTLTLCPIDRNLVDIKLLISEEKDWLNEYHLRIIKEAGPLLEPTVLEWLEVQCFPV